MKYDLVFEGGGAKGLVFVGALQAFLEEGHAVGRLIGASAGAITAALLAAGYTPDEIVEVIDERLPDGRPQFAAFLDVPRQFADDDIRDSLSYRLLEQVDIRWVPGPVEQLLFQIIIERMMRYSAYRHIFSFVEHGGWYAGDAFREWLRARLDAGGRNLGRATLAEFQSTTGSDLTLIASDTTAHQMLVLNHRTAPQCPLVWAVRMSMSYPFAWQEVRWDAGWGRYQGQEIAGHTVVDGGMLTNFPIDLFVSTDSEVVAVMGRDGRSDDVLGFLIDETLPVPGSDVVPAGTTQAAERGVLSRVDVKELEVVTRLKRMVDTVTQAHDKFVIDALRDNVCRLPAKGYGTLDFDVSDERRDALIGAGYEATKAYFRQKGEGANTGSDEDGADD